MRRRCGSACSTTRGAGASPSRRCARCCRRWRRRSSWVTSHDPFLSYRDESGRGLSNQGWKDSGDSIQDAGGQIADPPITLCEVQGYAYRAALDAARLLDAFDRPGGEAARAFAARIAAALPAAVLGRRTWRAVPRRRPRRRRAARRLADVEHRPPAGDRHPRRRRDRRRRRADPLARASTAGTGCARWPTTTRGTTRSATTPAACGRTTRRSPSTGWRGPVTATSPVAWRSGCWTRRRRSTGGSPSCSAGGRRAPAARCPYPASCRPQAWAAAAAFVVLRAALGLHVDVPAGTLAVRPDDGFAALFPLSVTGLRVGEHRLDVHVDAVRRGRPSRRDALLEVSLVEQAERAGRLASRARVPDQPRDARHPGAGLGPVAPLRRGLRRRRRGGRLPPGRAAAGRGPRRVPAHRRRPPTSSARRCTTSSTRAAATSPCVPS